MSLMINLFLAILPVVIIFLAFWFYTHSRKEVDLMKWSIIFGIGVLSAMIALLIESQIIKYVALKKGVLGSMIEAFLFVALVEELCRFSFLWLSYLVKKWFVTPLDFITAGLLLSLGFSTFENLSYAYQYTWGTMLARVFTAVPAHAAFGVIMGYFFYRYHKTRHIKFLAMAVIMPTFLHGLYDFFVIQHISESLLAGSLVILLLCVLWTIYILRDIKNRKFNQIGLDEQEKDIE